MMPDLRLTGWQPYDRQEHLDYAPRVLRGSLTLATAPSADTYFDFKSDWHHGVLFVNGFNVGRYYEPGPQKTLFIPAPLLRQGENEVW